MSKIINVLRKVCTKNLNKILLLTSIITIGASNKLSTKLIIFLIVLIIIKIHLPDKLSFIKCKLSNDEENDNNIESEIDANKDTDANTDANTDNDNTIENNNKEKINNHINETSESIDNLLKKEELNDNIINRSDNSEKNNNIKNNIKLFYKKVSDNDKGNKNPYSNNKSSIEKNYKNDNDSHEFILNVNSNTCSIPIFNMRTYADLDFYFNFIIHDFTPKKLNNLIMCKDIHKWVSTTSLTDEDLSNELVPLYYIKKVGDKTSVYEYLKIFIHNGDDETKNAFVQKGNDYQKIEDDIEELLEKGYIKDLLSSKSYINYNLSLYDGVCNFLDKFLSVILIPEECIGQNVYLNIENYIENKNTYEYHFNTVNAELNSFNTTI
jgi:hypothetical protein